MAPQESSENRRIADLIAERPSIGWRKPVRHPIHFFFRPDELRGLSVAEILRMGRQRVLERNRATPASTGMTLA